MKSLITTIVIIGLLGLLALTNPKMENYEQFIHDKILQETEKEDGLSKMLGQLLGGFASGLITNSTIKSDYVFLSIYDTKLGNDHIKVLGVLNNFIVLTQLGSNHLETKSAN